MTTITKSLGLTFCLRNSSHGGRISIGAVMEPTLFQAHVPILIACPRSCDLENKIKHTKANGIDKYRGLWNNHDILHVIWPLGL